MTNVYRKNPYEDDIADLDGRVSVLEHFADGRERCSGDELWDRVEKAEEGLVRAKKSIFGVGVTVIVCSIFTILFTLEAADMHKEQTQRQDKIIDALQKKVKCLEYHSYELDEGILTVRKACDGKLESECDW